MFAKQPEVEAEALKLYEAGDVEGAKAVLTKFSYESMENTLDQWWDFAWHLVGKYHDGLVLTEEGNKNPGYPTEWLEGVGYGQALLAAHNEYLASTGQAEEPAEPETPAEPEKPDISNAPVGPSVPAEPEAPAPEAPAEPEAPEESGSNTGLIIGVVVAVVIIAGAVWFFMKKKKN